MKVHTYEKAFLAVGLAVLLVCGVALVYATVARGIHLPGQAGRIDPRRVYQTPPFDKPGVREVGPGDYQAVIVSQTWAFVPPVIRVPVNARITFIATTVDVIHGFNVEGTRLNMMLVPGQISRNSYRFRTPGEYLVICHEYCGLGHHAMAGKVVVEATGDAADHEAEHDGEDH
jgi:cytochrome c oxidase subunit 2